MPEEILTTSTPEVITTPSNVDVDRGLEAALAKQFKNYTSENNEPQKEQPKVENKTEDNAKEGNQEITIELKKEKPARETVKEVVKDEKPLGNEDKPLPTPESLDESPTGKGQAAWNALKNNYKRSFKSIESKDAEITKLKASLAEKETVRQKEIESLKTRNQDLSKYQAMVDIQSDPEFIAKFDKPINEKVEAMKDLLRGWNIDEPTIKSINFLDKNTVGPLVKTLREGQQHISNEFELEEFMANARDVLDLTKKKDKELKVSGENYNELLETKKKESFSKGAEEEGRIVKHLENISQAKDTAGNSMFPFLSKITPKDNATQPEVDQINNHNEMVDLMNQKIKSVFKMNTPEERAEVAVAAVTSHYLAAQLKAATAKIASLQKELGKISNVTSETEKTKPSPVQRNGNGTLVRAGEAVDAYFARR